jgi:hypothetical protein
MARHFMILGVKVTGPGLRGRGVSLARVQKQALLETVQFWHTKVLPGHFEETARVEYRDTTAKRDKGYIFQTKLPFGEGLGRTLANRFHNKSQRWLKHLVTYRGTSQRATASMQAPSYFTHPYIGRIRDERTGVIRTISRQPDKPAEVTATSSADREELRAFYTARVTELISQALGEPVRASVNRVS